MADFAPRFRRTGPYETESLLQKWYLPPGGSPSLYDQQTYLTYAYDKGITDINTPDYKKRIAAGQIINNDCSVSESFTEETMGSYDTVSTGNHRYYITSGPVASYTGDLHGITPLTGLLPVDSGALIDRAKQQAVANIDQTPYGFAEDLAEIKDTIKFLKSPGKSLLDLARKSRKKKWQAQKKFKKSADIAEALNDSYLTYRFAATPLVRSVIDAIDAYKTRSDKRIEPRYSARGYAADSEGSTETLNPAYFPGAYTTISVSNEVVIKVRATILYTHTGNRGVAFQLGLRGKDIPVTAWNVVPLSFMVDRFFDISSAIRGVMNLSDPRLAILAASYSVKSNTKGKMTLISETIPGYTTSISGALETKFGSYHRTVWSPTASDTDPRFTPQNLVRDAQSIADLFSLSAAIISRSF